MKSPNRQVLDLRAVQNAGHALIDGAYAGLDETVARIVRRHCEKRDGTMVLTDAGLARAMLDIDKALAEAEPKLARRIMATIRGAERLGGTDPT